MSAALRERILAAAERLGYVPNLAARTLAARRSGVVGILVETLAEPLTAAVVAAIDRELGRAGYCLAIATGDCTPGDTLARARELLARGVDALLSWDLAPLSARAVAEVSKHGLPWLAFEEGGNTQGAVAAEIGRRKGTMLGCQYLLSLGHDRFGAIEAGSGGVEAAVREALAGTPARLLGVGTPEGPSDGNGIHEAISALLDRPDAPTAIICGSDLQAAAVLRECHLRGMAVPGAVSVIGFGDSELARQAWPSLTTVRVSPAEIGAGASEALLAMLDGVEPAPIEPAVKLAVRESTAGRPH